MTLKLFFAGKKTCSPALAAIIAITLAVTLGDIIFTFKIIPGQELRIRSTEERVNELRGSSGAERAASGVLAFKKRLPQRSELTRVLSEVFAIARRNGLKIEAGDYSPETVRDTDISRYTFSFPVEGGYGQIKKFIYDVEALRYPLVIEEIGLVSGKGDKKEDANVNGIGLKMKVSIYFM